MKEGDTLWDITENYYGDPYRWPQIWSYNPEITNPHWIYPDLEVRLRPDDGTWSRPRRPASSAPRPQPRRRGTPSTWRSTASSTRTPSKDAGYIIGGNEEHMMMVDTDIAYVRFNPDVEPEIGRVYTVFREMQEFERRVWEKGDARSHPRTGQAPRLRHAARGGTRPRRQRRSKGSSAAFASPRSSATSTGSTWCRPSVRMRATVVASLYPRKLPSTNQIVFVNAGAEQGVVDRQPLLHRPTGRRVASERRGKGRPRNRDHRAASRPAQALPVGGGRPRPSGERAAETTAILLEKARSARFGWAIAPNCAKGNRHPA